MQSTQLACPYCGSTLNFGKEIAAGTSVECLICMRAFAANPGAAPVSVPKAKGASDVGVPKQFAPPKARPVASQTAAKIPTAKPSEGTAQGESSGRGALLAMAAALLLLVGGGVGFAVWKAIDTNNGVGGSDDPGKLVAVLNKKDDPVKMPIAKGDDGVKPDPEKKKDPPKKLDDDPEEPMPAKKEKDKEEEKKVLVRKDPPKSEEKPPETVPITKIAPANKAIPGVNQGQFDSAIDKGLNFLKSKQQSDGGWGGFNHPIGFAGLCGLTLLECKVPANDPAVQKTVAYVRLKVDSVDKNYDAAAVILFLDRLGEARDRPVIQALALRLLASQLTDGGWNYTCNPLSPQESQQLLAFLQSHKRPAAKPMRPDTLSPSLRGLQVVQNQGKAKGKHVLAGFPTGDNSNTQFALLALWAARRHDVPTDQALLAAHDRFSQTQQNDGGWGYESGRPSSNGMTCVGLIGLAMGHGVSPDLDGKQSDDPKMPKIKPALQDPKIKKGMQALERYIGNLADAKSMPIVNLYFLWSLERVGMLYDLNDINGKDWYGWGAQMLVSRQGSDGGFPSATYINQEVSANTCFALLFLNRSNLVQDLTVTLQLNSGIRDPGR